MESLPLYQNLKIGTKCLSINNELIECNPMDSKQLWTMDINSKIINLSNSNKCLTINKNNIYPAFISDCILAHNNLSNTFIIGTITIDNITKRYLKDIKFNQYLVVSNNKLIGSSIENENSYINNLTQLRSPL